MLKRFYLGRQQEMTKLIDIGKLPAPIKTIKDDQVAYHFGFNPVEWVLERNPSVIFKIEFKHKLFFHQYLLETGQLFATAEDAKEWLQAMSNARR